MSVIRTKEGKLRIIENYIVEKEDNGVLYMLPTEDKKIVNNKHITESLKAGEEFTNDTRTREAIGQLSSSNIIDIEPIHEGATKNCCNYTQQCLIGGVPTWTEPVNKPVLKNHINDCDNTIGRVMSADYDIKAKCQKMQARIEDKDALQKIRDGRYLSVSIGSEIHSATCNICGAEIVQAHCGHYRGDRYKDGELSREADAIRCEWDIQKLCHEEVSVVGVPADENARITGISQGAYIMSGGESMDKDNVVGETAETKAETVEPTITATESVQTTESTEPEVYSYMFTDAGELEDDTNTEEAVLKSKSRSALPDSCFALVKNVEGRKIRTLVYRTAEGKIDETRLGKAVSSISKVKGFSSAEKARAKGQLKRLAKKAGLDIADEAVTHNAGQHFIELKTKISELTEQLEEKDDIIKELSNTIDTLENDMNSVYEEHSRLEAELAKAKESAHTERVDRLVDLKYITNRESVRSRDIVCQEYVTKNDNILLELIQEYSKGIVLEKPPVVGNETLPVESPMDNDLLEEKVVSTEESANEININTFEKPSYATIVEAMKPDGDKKAKEIVAGWQKLKVTEEVEEASKRSTEQDNKDAQ